MKLQTKSVLVRVQSPKTQDEDGIYIQEEWQDNEPLGTVEAIGDGVTFCKVGDKVWFERYTALINPSDKELRLCREESVLAIL